MLYGKNGFHPHVASFGAMVEKLLWNSPRTLMTCAFSFAHSDRQHSLISTYLL